MAKRRTRKAMHRGQLRVVKDPFWTLGPDNHCLRHGDFLVVLEPARNVGDGIYIYECLTRFGLETVNFTTSEVRTIPAHETR